MLALLRRGSQVRILPRSPISDPNQQAFFARALPFCPQVLPAPILCAITVSCDIDHKLLIS
jgi:hypothetical protein